jgi:hypothetical protein
MLKAYMQYTVTGDTGEARAIAIWVILIGTISLRVNLLIYTLLCVIMVINIAHLLAFLRAPGTSRCQKSESPKAAMISASIRRMNTSEKAALAGRPSREKIPM